MLSVIKEIIAKRKSISLLKKGVPFNDDRFNSFRKNKAIILIALDYDLNTLNYVEKSILLDKDIILKSIQKNPLNLQMHSDEEIIGNKEIILNAIKLDYKNIRFASENLKNDISFAKEILIKEPDCLEFFSNKIKDNKEIIDLVLSKFFHGKIFKYIGEKFKDDKDVVLKEMTHHGDMFEFVSDRLKADEEVLISSLKSSNGNSIIFASPTLKSNMDIVKNALQYINYSSINVFKDLGMLAQSNKEIALLAISKKPESYLYVSEDLKNDIDIVKTAIKLDGSLFKFIPLSFKQNKEIFLLAIKQYALAIEFATEEFKNNLEVAKIVLASKYDKTLSFFSDEIRDNKELVLFAVKNHASQLEFASKRLKMDYDLVKQAITQSGVTYRFIDENLKSDPYLIKKAIECSTGLALNYIDEKYLNHPEIKEFVYSYKNRYRN
jgi:hypothetical protein